MDPSRFTGLNGKSSDARRMENPRVAVFLGHPRRDAFCAALAEAFVAGVQRAGLDVRFLSLSELDYDPDVHTPSPTAQPLEPGLARAKQAIQWADHLVFIYPTWWSTMPALLKGFLDRILLPGFAFREDTATLSGYQPLLSGRTAHLITTMDSPAWVYRFIYGRPGDRAMKAGILGFCGIKPVEHTWIARVKELTPREREEYLLKVGRLGETVRARYQRQKSRQHFLGWIRIMRLPFYAMTLLSYGLGALAAVKLGGMVFHPLIFFAGFLCLFLLEFASVLFNEIEDQETDRLNKNPGPFTGGSRVLIDGPLSELEVERKARWVLSIAVICGVLIAILALPRVAWTSLTSVLLCGFILGPGYSIRPLRLVYRGFGELVVAVTHSFFMLLCGWMFMGGTLAHPIPWLLSLPLFGSILAAIILAGIPDHEADKAVEKRTFTVLTSPRVAALTAIAATLLTPLYIAGIQSPAPSLAALYEGVWIPIGVHSAILVGLLSRYLSAGAGCRRINLILATALSLVLWYTLGPLFTLFGSSPASTP